MARVVLVTGVSRDLAARLARAVAAVDGFQVIGVDVVPPRHDLGEASFVRADIRNPVIGKVISGRQVDTVVHMAMVATASSAGGRSSMKEINVIGTMQLLAACQKADSFRQLVVQSSVSVYGASPRDPARFTEDLSPRVQPRTGFGKDSVEVETYVRGLARRRPDVAVTTLRLANLMGAGVDSQVARYLSLPVVPKVMGFDARLQFLHPSDAIAALQLSIERDVPGTYNVGASDIITLTQALRMMGRPSIGIPREIAPAAASIFRQARLSDFTSDEIAALTYGRGMDTTRFTEATGFRPRFSSREALEEFVSRASPGALSSERVERVLGALSKSSPPRRQRQGNRRMAKGTENAGGQNVQPGSKGPAGRGSMDRSRGVDRSRGADRSRAPRTPSAAARGLAAPTRAVPKASDAVSESAGKTAARPSAKRASKADTSGSAGPRVSTSPTPKPNTKQSSQQRTPAPAGSGAGPRRKARTTKNDTSVDEANAAAQTAESGTGQKHDHGDERLSGERSGGERSGGERLNAEQEPIDFDLAALLGELTTMATGALEKLRSVPIDEVRQFAADPLRGVLSLAEALGVDWHASLDEMAGFARSRMSGEYAIDEFGFDPEFTSKIFLPLLRPLVQSWFRVEVRGIENLPESGSALVVSNHAGTMPLDGMVLHSVIHDEIGRHLRMLGADLIFKTPFSHDLARRTGATLACQEDAERLLAADQLVSVFPEGFKGLGKPYADRYKLQRFGRGGFVSAAVRAQVPIIPVSIVGSEEIYPLISGAPGLARAMGVPYFPVTPLFPWLGVLGMIPLPSKWIIQFGEAIATDELPAGAAEDPMIVFNVTDQVRETIQHTLYALLMQRRSVFF